MKQYILVYILTLFYIFNTYFYIFIMSNLPLEIIDKIMNNLHKHILIEIVYQTTERETTGEDEHGRNCPDIKIKKHKKIFKIKTITSDMVEDGLKINETLEFLFDSEINEICIPHKDYVDESSANYYACLRNKHFIKTILKPYSFYTEEELIDDSEYNCILDKQVIILKANYLE